MLRKIGQKKGWVSLSDDELDFTNKSKPIIDDSSYADDWNRSYEMIDLTDKIEHHGRREVIPKPKQIEKRPLFLFRGFSLSYESIMIRSNNNCKTSIPTTQFCATFGHVVGYDDYFVPVLHPSEHPNQSIVVVKEFRVQCGELGLKILKEYANDSIFSIAKKLTSNDRNSSNSVESFIVSKHLPKSIDDIVDYLIVYCILCDYSGSQIFFEKFIANLFMLINGFALISSAVTPSFTREFKSNINWLILKLRASITSNKVKLTKVVRLKRFLQTQYYLTSEQ